MKERENHLDGGGRYIVWGCEEKYELGCHHVDLDS